MTEDPASRRALAVTVVLLIAASAALGGAATLDWARVGFQHQFRGVVEDRVDGSALLPALAPLALLALAAVAAVLATAGWARWMLGALLLVAAALLAVGVLRVADEGWLTGAAVSAAGSPARSVLAGTTTVLPAGPGFAAGGAVLLAAAGVALVARGHRMPRLGRRYQAPAARPSGLPEDPQDERLWERMDAGEDPTASGTPPVTGHRTGRS
ncbi:MAG TPA: Trp biosynthesis-associated membrane protein [Pseudonocardiaceae bacterium]|nr:Trp biosynthesis-associated membrane protein [Pseudonocardiaceae bacterium]